MIVVVIILSILLVVSMGAVVLLVATKNDVENKLKKSRNSNKELKEESERLSATIADKGTQIQAYETQLKDASSTNLVNANKMAELQSSNESLIMQIESLQKEKTELKSILKKREGIVDKTDQVDRLKTDNSKLSDEVERLKTVNDKLSDDNQSLSHQVKKLDEKLKNVSVESELVRNLKVEIAEKEKVIAENEISRQELERKRSVILEENNNLQFVNSQWQQELMNLRKQNIDLVNNNNALSSELTKCNSDLEKLRTELSNSIATDKELVNQNKELTKKLSDASSLLEKQQDVSKLKQENEWYVQRIEELEKEIAQLKGNHKPPQSPVSFILFKDGEYEETLSRLSNIKSVMEFLQKSDFEKSNGYLKTIKNYLDEIDDLEDVFSRLDEDEEEMSMACVNKFSKVFREYIAESIMEPAFRAKDDEDFYSELLNAVMDYLNTCGIYTKDVVVGSKFEKMNYMDIIAEDTTDVAKHKMISRVVSLPFFAKYTSDTGKLKEKLLSKGSCVVLKAK